MGLEIVIAEPDQWGELHSDLLDEVVKHVNVFGDYVSLRAVCKSWNLKLPKIPKHIRSPRLVLPFDDATFEIENESYHLRLPEMHNTMLRGSCFGWLISVGVDGILRMLNPVTKIHFDLPPMSTIPDIVAYQPDRQGMEYTLRDIRSGSTYTADSIHIQKVHIEKIIITSPPNLDKQDFMAVVIYGEYNRLAFCKCGDNRWTDVPTPKVIDCGYEEVIFHEGKIFALAWRARLYAFDMKTLFGGINKVRPPHDLFIPYFLLNNKYLVWSPEGDLIMAVRHLEETERSYRTSRFEIYKVNKSAKQWSRVFSLGNYVLVVGFNSSVWISPFPDVKGNCIRNCIYYYTDNKLGYHHNQVIGGHDIGVFNLKDGSINQLLPNSDFLCPPPVWLLDY